MNPAGRRLLAALLLVTAYAVISTRRLGPVDRLYVVDAPLLGLAPRQVAPGWRFVPWLVARVASYPAAPVGLRLDLSGARAAASREGATLEVEVDLTYAIPPERLLDLHRAHGPRYEAWLGELAARVATERLREVPYDAIRDRDPEFQRRIQGELAEGAARDGIQVIRLRIVQVAAAGEASGTILKAEGTPLQREVLLIGVDSFDWRIIEPLMREGRMPNLARLVERGTRAHLRTISPILSPVIWTSIATGVKPSRHGIVDFVVAARDTGALMPVTSAMRQVPALWTLLSRQAIDVDVIAWWATWPAETVRGRIVTDRVAFQLFEDQMQEDWKSADPARARGKTFPPELFDEVRPIIKAPAEVSDAELARFLPPGTVVASLNEDRRHQLDEFRTILAGGETYHAAALKLFQPGAPGLKMIYYEGPDTTSHQFMRYRPPLLPGVEPSDMRLFGGIVDRYYELQDKYIGEVVARAGKDATILVVSDHGFKSDNNRPPHSDPRIGKADAAEWHLPIGVFVMAGPDVRPGFDLGSASVLDVAPTILTLFGLPVARDMDGQPLTQALTDRFLAGRPVRWVNTYGGLRPTPQESASAPSTDDAEIIAKLRNIGYIGEERMTARNNRGVIALDEGDVDGAIADFQGALDKGGDAGNLVRTNLARAWLQKGDRDKARALAGQALAENPRNKQAETILAAVEMKGQNFEAAENHLRRAIAIDPTFVPARSQLGRLYAKRERYAEALEEYRKVIEVAPLSAPEHNSIGEIYRKMGQPERAMEAYREALRCDAQYFGAYNNLGLRLQEKGKLDEAKALYEKGLAIRPENPILRNSLGTLLALQADRSGALKEFGRAAKADPEWPIAAGNLATLLFETGKFEEARPAFETWVRLEPEAIDARLGLALELLMIGRRDEAIAQFKEVLNRDPRNVRALIALGETLARQGDLEAAQARLEAAAGIDPRVPRILNSLGDVLLKRGLKQAAAAALHRSLTIDPKQPEIRQRLTEIAREVASKKEGVADLQRPH
ncbi:MAG TPA: tetratricopeptide repeat protein [Candidatus Polarisedimenticolia bacterium]